MQFEIDPALVNEAKQLREKAKATKNYHAVYNNEYHRSGYWSAVNAQMKKYRAERCAICRTRDSVHLYHLQYRE
jgi:hypothetical protein